MLNRVVDLLIARTKAGKVHWQPADRNNSYIAVVGTNSVTLDGATDPITGRAGVMFPAIVLRDADGNTRATGGGLDGLLNHLSAKVDLDKLTTLAKLVYAQAGGVDPILYEFEADLTDD